MDSRIAVCMSLAMAALFGANAFGQTVALPQPVAVIKDADGKVVGQLTGTMGAGYPFLLLNIGGTPGCFEVFWWGLSSCSESAVYFSEPGCTGLAYVQPPTPYAIESMTRVKFAVLGPNPTDGTYRMFRSTSNIPAMTYHASHQWTHQDCEDQPGTSSIVNAVEVSPNPLADLHGPTLANPERVWTIEGGDRLP